MADYRLSSRAADDLAKIADYTIDNFGVEQARRYRDALEACFCHLAENPRLGRDAGEVAPDLRRHEHQSHIETFDSVWDAIEDTPAEAENMKIRSALMIELKQHIERQGWTQREAAQRLGVTQPRMSDLMRGKVTLFGLDTLVNMSVAAGLNVELHVGRAA